MDFFVISPGLRIICRRTAANFLVAIGLLCVPLSASGADSSDIAPAPDQVTASKKHFQDWRTVPVPNLIIASTAQYHHRPVNRGNKKYGESLVKASDFALAADSYYARKDGWNAPYRRRIPNAAVEVMIRKTVAQKLIAVNRELETYGVEVLILDGWRSIEVQKSLWNYFVDVARKKLGRASQYQCDSYAAKYCSDPRLFKINDESTWTVHITGGAVDLTLKRKGTDEQLFMGSIFDDASPVSSTAFFEKKTSQSESEVEAKRNRRLLFHAMTSAGFTNYPNEWWHYDFGDQMWSMVKHMQSGKAEPAFYGPVTPDSSSD